MANETIYFNGFNKAKETQYSIKISGNVDKLIAELEKHKNEKGYINLELKKRKEPDQYGNTHYVVLDTWEPAKASTAPAKSAPQVANTSTDISDDNLPF
jgi:hypothetical protein